MRSEIEEQGIAGNDKPGHETDNDKRNEHPVEEEQLVWQRVGQKNRGILFETADKIGQLLDKFKEEEINKLKRQRPGTL